MATKHQLCAVGMQGVCSAYNMYIGCRVTNCQYVMAFLSLSPPYHHFEEFKTEFSRFQPVSVLSRATGFWDRLITEAIEIQVHSNTFNRDIVLHLSSA